MKKKIKILSLIILFLGIILFSSKTYCADGTLKASQSKSGNKITVTVTSTKSLGAFTLKATGLTATSGSSSVGDWGNNTIAGASASGVTKLGNFVFNVPEKDTKVTFSVTGVEDKDSNPLTISPTSITLKSNKTISGNTTTNNESKDNTTTSTTQKSNNAYLSTLGVTPKEYDFSGFSKTKTSYSVTVPNDVDSLKVSYKTVDPKATVKVTGNSGFDVGSNNAIKVVVTAEDGKTTKTYTIKVTKLATEDDKPGNLIEEDTNLYLTSLSIDDLELSPEFAKDTYSYSATLSNSDVTDLKVEAKANNDKANIDISGNTGLVEGENTINIILTLEGSSVKTVYQVVVTKDTASVATTSENAQNSNNDLMGSIKKYIGIAVVVIALIIVAVIVLIILLRKENKRLNGEDVIEDDENQNNEEEYNVYKNDVNEFENNNEPENFIESLYRQRNGNLYNEEELDEQDKETLEEINKETDNIFRDKVQGQSVEYDKTEFGEENPLEERRKRRGKGKHF